MGFNKMNRILIVDDSVETIGVFSNILREKKYDITFALDGPEALSKLKEKNFELVLLDIKMPVMNGFEVLEEMKKNDRASSLPVILISQWDDTENIVKGFKMGCRDFISKDTPPEVLLARVSTHLKLHHASLLVNNELLKVNEKFSVLYEKSKDLIEESMTVNELKKDFLSFATQDMINYLTNIKGCTYKIDQSSEQLSKKLNEITDKAVRESGIRMLQKSHVDIGELAAKVVTQQHEYSNLKEIHVEESIEKDCIVYGDEMVLEQIIDNLVSNAVKFSPPGKKVNVSISKLENKVKIMVKDEGPGFTEEDKLNLYKKYKPLSARPIVTRGELPLGIGLYITKDYVELHKGKIHLDSVHGKGALFTVEIPVNEIN